MCNLTFIPADIYIYIYMREYILMTGVLSSCKPSLNLDKVYFKYFEKILISSLNVYVDIRSKQTRV